MEARTPLSRTQSAVLDAIRTSVRERGFPPTLREVGATVGLASSSSVAHVIRVLEARGYLHCTPGSPRSLTILDDPTDTGWDPQLELRAAGRALINACLAAAVDPENREALGAQVRSWDRFALALDAAEDAAHGHQR